MKTHEKEHACGIRNPMIPALYLFQEAEHCCITIDKSKPSQSVGFSKVTQHFKI